MSVPFFHVQLVVAPQSPGTSFYQRTPDIIEALRAAVTAISESLHVSIDCHPGSIGERPLLVRLEPIGWRPDAREMWEYQKAIERAAAIALATAPRANGVSGPEPF